MSTGQPHSHTPAAPAQNPADVLDIREHGLPKDGVPQTTERRLYCQLQVFTGCSTSPDQLIKAVESSGLEAVLYLDVNDPQGVGLLVLTEDPAVFVGPLRQMLNAEPFVSLKRRPEMTMLGRTYSGGREANLEDWLLCKPRRNAFNRQFPWVVWYPLRRKPEFELLTKEEQTKILYEHAKIGMTYGASGYAHDIRLACHGIDAHDNEFVLGLISPDLYPLSRLVQDMRKTQQTARYIQSLGPFFVGKVLWQFPYSEAS